MSVERQSQPSASIPLNEHDRSALIAELASKDAIVHVLVRDGKFDEAESILRDNLYIRQSPKRLGLPAYHPDVRRTKSNLAGQLNGRFKCNEAETLLREVLETDVSIHGPEHPCIIDDMSNLAQVYMHLGDFDETILMQRQALSMANKIYSSTPSNPTCLRIKGNLGCALHKKGELVEAEKLLREVKETFEHLPADEDDEAKGHNPYARADHLGIMQNNLAAVWGDMGRFRESEATFKQVIAEEKNPLNRSISLFNLGGQYRTQGMLVEAEKVTRQGLEDMVGAVGKEDPRVQDELEHLNRMLHQQGRDKEADKLCVEDFVVEQ